MTARTLPPQEFLRECFDYDPDTGLFRWKHRPDDHFDGEGIAKAWNSKMAGARAFVTKGPKADDPYFRAEVTYEGSRYHLRASRVAWKLMTGEEHPMIDHRNLDALDNRFVNLRASDKMGNRHNAPGHRNHPFPKGVTLEGGRFRAKGKYKGVVTRLGTFSTPAEAHEAYCAWARPLHGEFFNPGPPKPTVFD